MSCRSYLLKITGSTCGDLLMKRIDRSASLQNASLMFAKETTKLKFLEAQLMEEEKMASIPRIRAELNTMFELKKTKQEVALEESDDDLNSQEDPPLDIPKLSSIKKQGAL